jgi:hypothetical protein
LQLGIHEKIIVSCDKCGVQIDREGINRFWMQCTQPSQWFCPNCADLEYLRQCLQAATITPCPWGGEDKNIGAFRSKQELIAWYCQPPGAENQPYRDRAFYTRELAMLSRIIKPKTVVEFGTCQGIGTCLLSWLNPKAWLATVDVNAETFLPGDIRAPMGTLAKRQKIVCHYETKLSWEYQTSNVDLCFIDADHSYEAVAKDSETAWLNRSQHGPWAIAWHDYNERHLGVVRAVGEFYRLHGLELQSRPDSDTVWVWGNLS